MSQEKKFRLSADEIVDKVETNLGCIATDNITVDGMKVGHMFRDEPDNERDSGWQFFSGTETDEYVDEEDNLSIYAVNTIANYDPAIIPYLHLPVGTELERIAGTDKFNVIPR
jgi:hypothetical protein